MALEIKVYREITAYQSKVMLGMSWRQMACAAVGLVVVGGAYALCWWADQSYLGSWVASILTMPFIAVGWVRPKGLTFEKWARYAWLHHWNAQRRVYAQAPVLSTEVLEERYTYAAQATKRLKRNAIHDLELDR